jgi:hypothetical protein
VTAGICEMEMSVNGSRDRSQATALGTETSLASGRVFSAGIDDVTILVLRPNVEADKRRGISIIDHGLNLPDHPALANAGV